MRMYEIVAFIDGGGFADVFRALRRGTTHVFAIKKLREHRDPEQRRRFAREVKMIQDLKHDRIIKIVDANVDAEEPFYVMQLMTGGSLASWAGRLPISSVRLITMQLADALAHIHGRGGLHRDIKPDNLLIDANGDFAIGDFGLGNNPRFTVMFTAHAAGTWGYMAPELLLPGAVATRAADIYSVGATVFNLLTGVHPGHATSLDPAWYRGDVPDDLRALVLGMLSADPRHRPTAVQVHHALKPAPPVAKLTPTAAPAKPNGSGAIAAIVGFGILALIAAAASRGK